MGLNFKKCLLSSYPLPVRYLPAKFQDSRFSNFLHCFDSICLESVSQTETDCQIYLTTKLDRYQKDIIVHFFAVAIFILLYHNWITRQDEGIVIIFEVPLHKISFSLHNRAVSSNISKASNLLYICENIEAILICLF